jgi:hypothetical protein
MAMTLRNITPAAIEREQRKPSPALVEQIAELQRLVRDQGAELVAQAGRIADLEARSGAAHSEDGRPRPLGTWCKAKEAAHRLGYSPSGLRKLAKEGRIVFDTEGNGRRIYNIASVVAPSAPSVP